MNEVSRLHYLEALGVSVYAPRFALPGAKPSPCDDWDIKDSPVSPLLNVETLETIERELPPIHAWAADTEVFEPALPLASPPVANVLHQLKDAFSAGKGKNLAQEAASVAAPPDSVFLNLQSVQEIEPFVLNIWPINAQLLILDSRHPQQLLPTQTLLNNILLALHLPSASIKPETLSFLPKPLQAHLVLKDAQEMLQGFLAARLAKTPTRFVWCMGEPIFKCLYPQQLFQAQCGKLLNNQEQGILMAVLPSLSAMILNPKLKAVTWACVRELNVH